MPKGVSEQAVTVWVPAMLAELSRGPKTVTDLAVSLNVSRKTIRRWLLAFRQQGLVYRHSSDGVNVLMGVEHPRWRYALQTKPFEQADKGISMSTEQHDAETE